MTVIQWRYRAAGGIHSKQRYATLVVRKETKTDRVRRVAIDDATAALVAKRHEACKVLAQSCDVELVADALVFSAEPTVHDHGGRTAPPVGSIGNGTGSSCPTSGSTTCATTSRLG